MMLRGKKKVYSLSKTDIHGISSEYNFRTNIESVAEDFLRPFIFVSMYQTQVLEMNINTTECTSNHFVPEYSRKFPHF